MSRMKLAIGVCVLTFVLSIGVISAPRLVAQEGTATPAIATTELTPGFTAQVLGAVPSDRAPGQTVYTVRFDIQPGASIFPHSHPGTTSLTVYSGTLGWTLVKGTAHIIRGAAAGATGPVEDVTQPNQEVTLNPGDLIYYEDDVTHTARNPGNDPTVVYGSFVLTAGAPLLMPAGMNMGTPTP